MTVLSFEFSFRGHGECSFFHRMLIIAFFSFSLMLLNFHVEHIANVITAEFRIGWLQLPIFVAHIESKTEIGEEKQTNHQQIEKNKGKKSPEIE